MTPRRHSTRLLALLLLSLASGATIQEIIADVCKACEPIWLIPNPPANNLQGAIDTSEDAITIMDRCYAPVDAACADCKEKERGCMYSVEMMGVDDPSSLLSSQFSFCRGHSAMSSQEMSLIAWYRIIEWKRENCAIPEMPQPIYVDDFWRDFHFWPYTKQYEYERQQKAKAEGRLLREPDPPGGKEEV